MWFFAFIVFSACSPEQSQFHADAAGWSASTHAPILEVRPFESAVLAVTEGDAVEAFAPDGELLWQWDAPGPITGVIDRFGDGVAIATDQNLIWLDTATGRSLRSRPLPVGHAVLFESDNSILRVGPRLHRCTLSTAMDLRCTPQSETSLWEGAASASGGIVAVAGARLSRRSGRDWDFHAHGAFLGPPTVEGATAIAAAEDGHLYARYADDGTERWTFTPTQAVSTPVTVFDGMLYFGTQDGYIYANQSSNGAMRWRARLSAPILGAIAAGAHHLTLATEDGALHAVDREWAQPLWSASLDGVANAGPRPWRGGWVVGTDAGEVRYLDPADDRAK
jgi:outer membrane protein assembly factor BamB